jgi:hypothetical protein
VGHHIDDKGRFQSDKYPDLPPDKVILSFSDPAAIYALKNYAWHVHSYGGDTEFADDLIARIKTVEKGTPPAGWKAYGS